MLRVILGIVAGFIAWSILWVGSDQVLTTLNPDWYGAHQLGFQKAITNNTPFTADNTILGLHLVREVIITLISGLIAAVIARGNRNAPLGLGIVLLLAGIGVEAMAWNYAPLWYHLAFLGLLIPTAIMGGRLKKV